MALQNLNPSQIDKLEEIQRHISQDIFQEQDYLKGVERLNRKKLKHMNGLLIATNMCNFPEFVKDMDRPIDLKALLFCIADAKLDINPKRYNKTFEDFAKKIDVDKLYDAWKLAISAKPPVPGTQPQPDKL